MKCELNLGGYGKALIVWMIACPLGAGTLWAQSGDVTVPNYRGVHQQEGMLVFDDQETFDLIYEDLYQRVLEWQNSAAEVVETPGDPCPDDDPVLAAFESQLRFTSVRKVFLQRECEELANGTDPDQIEDHHLVDDILAAMVNASYQLQIGADIFYMPTEETTYQIRNSDYGALRALERGANPYQLENVTVLTAAGGCDANFSVNTDNASTVVGYSFTGTPTGPDVSFFWEFGDGQISYEQNPIHEYASNGTYTVCLTVESTQPDLCVDRLCKDVLVGEGGCQAFFIWNETGQEGGVCFLDNSIVLGNVVSWEWNFGDGSAGSNQQNPCHTFPCDKTYLVTLHITTAAGCHSYVTEPVNVDSYQCCGKKAKTSGEAYYNDAKNKIKYKQRHLQLPFIYRVVAKMKNYRRKPNGNWKKEKADLKIETLGYVFTAGQAGCICQEPYSIDGLKFAFNKKKLSYSQGIGVKFKAKKNEEWRVKYYVNNLLVLEKETPVTCD